MKKKKTSKKFRNFLSLEQGTIRKQAPIKCVLLYPSPYTVAMSSLGYQSLYRIINEIEEICCERATLESFQQTGPILTLESGTQANEAAIIGLSVATEAEIASAARALMCMGLPPLEKDRRNQGTYPIIVAGGPLTFADPRPLCALADVVFCGEAEESLTQWLELFREVSSVEELLDRSTKLPGVLVPSRSDVNDQNCFAVAEKKWLPAYSAIITPKTEFGDMFLIEPARGCPRKCGFCVMEGRKFRSVPVDDVLSRIPEHAKKVGLVGAALGDHPKIAEILSSLVDSGRTFGLSSLRADRLDRDFIDLLVKGGVRTLTVAADGASQRLRDLVRKKLTAETLLKATELAASGGLRNVKLYAMIGLPTEEDEDISELIDLALEMARMLPVSLAVSPFVPKRGTSLSKASFARTAVLRRRLSLLRKSLRGKVDLRSTSIRGAWIENAVARGGIQAGEAAVEVARKGGDFNAWREAFSPLSEELDIEMI